MLNYDQQKEALAVVAVSWSSMLEKSDGDRLRAPLPATPYPQAQDYDSDSPSPIVASPLEPLTPTSPQPEIFVMEIV
jgi:hypothetical protein